MERVTFVGTVFSGKGEGKRFVDLQWVKVQIQEKLGFLPYAGTLNIYLTAESIEKRKLLSQSMGILIEPQAGFCPGILFKASIGKERCAVVLPKTPSYPNHVLEVISPVYLREKMELADGNAVSVTVMA